jgi:HTH-like domain/Integrase core domain
VKVHPFLGAEKAAGHGTARACRLLKVSRAAYYQRRNGVPSPRAAADAAITARITSIHAESKGTYGSPRVHQALHRQDVRCGKRRVARLMRAAGLEGRRKKRWRATTIADPAAQRARDLIGRDFAPRAGTDRRYAGDITYIMTWEGWAYLATVIDLSSRRVVGWALADHMRTSLVEDAMSMAFARRRPAPGVIFHSDRGCQDGFNWPSQHLLREVCDGGRAEAGASAGVSGSDPVAGPADGGMAGRPGAVLGGDRAGGEDRGRGGGGRRVGAGGVPVVPPRWRRETMPAAGGVGAVLVVC